MKFGVRKLESWGYQMVKKSCRYSFLRFDTIPARDGQTDRHVAITITRASIASRGYIKIRVGNRKVWIPGAELQCGWRWRSGVQGFFAAVERKLGQLQTTKMLYF